MPGSGKTHWIEEALQRVQSARVAVFGDFCLDAYWEVDEDSSERSLETGLPLRKVRSQHYSPGGAANVAVNLVDLGVGRVDLVGPVGDDPFGRELVRLLAQRGIEAQSGLLRFRQWQTMVYAKPHLAGAEQNRLDFGAFNELNVPDVERLAEALDRAAEHADAVVLNQQIPGGASPPVMIERLNELIAAHPRCTFLVDSRHRAGLYRGAMLKLNLHEAARLCGKEGHSARAPAVARQLRERTARPVFLTLGKDGILVADAGGEELVPGIPLEGETDPVGAGDTVAAALAAALAAREDARSAASLANLAASVTVSKLYSTGTATPEEIREAARRANQS